ncbi:LuxR C-terminal-related transcriptional regulator [Hahella aquimaris]|uniref:LuxR C-terminal-related transcriptional regulator n=1 Tax=Hahella sp. HNIBRBA332 TaxID=3015983 RepID=UPI00273AD033|nr:LuxR C-terminal-related transcriptional regulator [Hahella sp. HNIBRBA332]WLQ16272.1 LuxR C-terminal-related transcriptional regulator [Hahella sp. HNIBRBA332]
MASQIVISRRRLTRKLDAARQAQIHCVTAPAGFGKTTLMQDWAAPQKSRVIWFAIERSDNRLLRLGGGLLAAFASAGYGFPGCKDELGLLNERSGVARWSSLFVAELEAAARRNDASLTLVLDNLHLLDAPEAIGLLACLVRDLPAPHRLCLLSRNPLPPALFASTSWNRIHHLNADELAFTLEEGKQYLRALQAEGLLGRYATPGSPGMQTQLSELWRQTDGWPIFFCALANRMANRNAPFAARDELNTLPDFHRYMEEQVMQPLQLVQKDMQSRLRELAPISEFNRDLLSQCLLPGESPALIQAMIHHTGLIVKAGQSNGEYRLRRPLREHLRQDATSKTVEAPSLFDKAFRWRLANHQGMAAITLCIDNGYWRAAVHMLEKLYPSLISAGCWTQVAHWLAAVPAHIVEQRPLLQMLLGRKALFESAPASALMHCKQAQTLLSSARELDHPEAVYEASSRARWLREASALIASTQALYATGQAQPVAESAPSCLLTRYHQGLHALHQGRLYEARQRLTQVMEAALADDPGTLIQVIQVLGWLHYLIGETDLWRSGLASLRERLAPSCDLSHWFAWTSASTLFGLLENADTDEVTQGLQDASVLHGLCAPAELRFNLAAAQALLAIREARWDEAGEALMEAEVLHHSIPHPVRQTLFSMPALKAQRLQAQGGEREALHLLQAWGGHSDQACFASQHEQLILSEILFALNRPEASLEPARQVKAWAEQRRCGLLLTRALAVEALALQKLGREEKAQQVFHDALHVGRMTSSLHSLVRKDAPEMKSLLAAAKQQGRYPAYVGKLIQHYGQDIEQNDADSASLAALSKREKQVLDLLVTGMSNPEIADALCRSLGTVKIHVHNIYRKLGAANRVSAINKYNVATA